MCQIEGEYSHFWLDSAKCSCKSLLPQKQNPAGWAGKELWAAMGWGSALTNRTWKREEGKEDGGSSHWQPKWQWFWHLHATPSYWVLLSTKLAAILTNVNKLSPCSLDTSSLTGSKWIVVVQYESSIGTECFLKEKYLSYQRKNQFCRKERRRVS